MRHTVEQHMEPCGCRSVEECNHNFGVEMRALQALVDDFAAELVSKLRRKMTEGKAGWDDPRWPRQDIIRQLQEHIDKGDMRDVAIFAMFAWNRSDDPEP